MKAKAILITLIAILAVTALIFQSCKKDEKNNELPTCKITAPTNNQSFVKGETVTISVASNDSDGIIHEVRFFIDNVGKSSVTHFPYNYDWNTNNEGFGNHTLKVTSFDNSGGSNSDEITIAITENNTPPTALFTVSPNNGTTITNFVFDASGSTDNEDPTNSLQVRWDFDSNGSWDTGWDTDKTVHHQYSSGGIYTAKLEVKDTKGLTDQYTKSITVNNIFTDPRDGRIYQTIEIGSQTWMAENLNYQTANSWTYDNAPANGNIYGRLYTWAAAKTACPSGWSLPSDNQWKQLEMALGMSQSEADDTGYRGTDEGGKMKETGTTHWNSPNTGATNSSGFNARPGGYRYSDGSFGYLGDGCDWWSSTEYSGTHAWSRSLYYYSDQVLRYNLRKTGGFSVRCLKN